MGVFRFFLIIILTITIYSCNDDFVNEHSIDNEIIINYIAQNNIEAYHYSDGLYYSIENEDLSCDFPNLNSTVELKYKGYLVNGTVIDSSNNTFVSIDLNECIQGLQLGIPLFSKNSKGMLFIPSNLAYGEFSTENIPSHSVIIYEIELKNFSE